MKLHELVKRLTVLSDLPEDCEVTGVTDNTAKIQPGCVFVCIEGNRFDGHTAAQQALDAGAVAVVAQKETGVKSQLLVEDTRAAYAMLCAAFYGYPAEQLKLVGVTGTNGKTTTCFLLKSIFEAAGYRCGLVGTVKNMIADKEIPAQLTTPDPLELQGLFAQMVEAGCQWCFMEVSSQALAQQRVAGMEFEAALFTNLTQDHLDYHGTFENYKAAKHILFEHAKLAVINMDDEAGAYMLEGTSCKNVTFSQRDNSTDYTAKNVTLKADGCVYELVGKSVIERVRFGVPGAFSVSNSMGAAVLSMELGVPGATVTASLAGSTGVPGRLEVLPIQKEYTVIIDYAHSPDGLENVLTALNETKVGRMICVFGCGGDRDKTKRPIMGRIAGALADIAIVTSDNPRTENPDAILEDILAGMQKSKAKVIAEVDRTKAIGIALKTAKAGDVILLAGKGHETYQILNTGKIHYDEREVVAKLLEAQN